MLRVACTHHWQPTSSSEFDLITEDTGVQHKQAKSHREKEGQKRCIQIEWIKIESGKRKEGV